MVKHLKGAGYRVIGNESGRNFGTFPTKNAAHKRELQVQAFKYGHLKGKK
jgi:hypothetical protein